MNLITHLVKYLLIPINLITHLIKYLLTYIVANAHCLYYKYRKKSWHKNNRSHTIILGYRDFELVEVGCTCGEQFWRKHATEQISRSA